MRIGVLIAEDLTMMGDFMAQFIDAEREMCVVGRAHNGREAVDLHARLRPTVTVMDLAMPDMDGVEATYAIRATDRDAKILILTALGGEEAVHRGLRAGACGYLLKGGRGQELLGAIRAVAKGERYVPTDVAVKLAERLSQEPLTEREIAVLKSIATGSTKETARRLNITTHGVNWHIQKAIHKLGVENRTQAMEKARNMGLLPGF